jgi:ABC-type Fe3+/spermidine/putrescine transport system ATPase subunit
MLLVRPEDFRLAVAGESAIDAEVAEVVYLGELTSLRLRLAGAHDVWMRQMKLPAVKVGDRVRVCWDPSSVRLLESVEGQDQQGGYT